MLSTWNAYAGWSVSALAASAIGLMLVPGAVKSNATPKGDAVHVAAMPVAQQNMLVQKYCGVCHTDATMTGGFSLQHYDAAHADPVLSAMLLSKLTGWSLETISAVNTGQATTAAIDTAMKSNAIHAAGVPLPDSATLIAWGRALSAEAAGATKWMVNQVQNPQSQAPVLTASVAQEVPTANDPTMADMYRLTITCDTNARKGEIKLAWSPGTPPQGQEISAASDGKTPLTYKIEGLESMRIPLGKPSGLGDIVLKANPLPKKTLTVGNLPGGEAVVFPFNGLPRTARHELSACFANSNNAH